MQPSTYHFGGLWHEKRFIRHFQNLHRVLMGEAQDMLDREHGVWELRDWTYSILIGLCPLDHCIDGKLLETETEEDLQERQERLDLTIGHWWQTARSSNWRPRKRIRGAKRTQLFYLSKSTNTAMKKYSVTSKSLEFNIYWCKTKVLVSKCTKYQKQKVPIMQNEPFHTFSDV